MTKQEQIKKETNKLIDNCYTRGSSDYPKLLVFQRQKFLNELFPLLDRLGVVIKVERETTDFIKCPCDDCTAENKLIDEWGYFCDLACGQRSHWISRCVGASEARNAGYVAVEPLIREKA